MKLLSGIILFSQLCLGQGMLTSHSCLLAAKQENLDLEQWICNETNSDLPCVIKDRTSLNAKFGMKNGKAIPVPSSLSVCGSGSVDGKDCRYTTIDYKDLRLEWEEWTTVNSMETRTARVTDGFISQPCPYITDFKYRDCAEIYHGGKRTSGVYMIYPYGGAGMNVTCDMVTDGGGWTVFQKRYSGEVDFFRVWEEYAAGFGDPEGEYWLGLRHIHTLTQAKPTVLYVGLTDFDVGSRFAKYGTFEVSSEAAKFQLTVGSYSGNAGDSLADHNGQKFSTRDEDNDSWPGGACSNDWHGAWWYNMCLLSNLNGQFSATKVTGSRYMIWYHLQNTHQSMKSSVMMMRPANFIP